MEPRFRINAKHLFLTYPRCHLDKQVAYDQLVQKFTPERIIVSREDHADGTPHLHAYLGLYEKRNFTTATFADLFLIPDLFHGNYQAVHSVKATIKYVTKDKDYLSNFDIEKPTTQKSRREWASDQVVNHRKPLHELVIEDPQLIFGYNRLLQDISSFCRDCSTKTSLDLPPFLPNPWGLVLPSSRAAKRRHFWLWSERPNVGKSFHFAKPLEADYKAVIQAGDFSYWGVSLDTQLLILDEYNNPGLKYNQLNSMCDGTFGYRIFHGGVVRLASTLIIVLSNQPISTLYPFKNELLYARFIEKKLD